MWKTSIATTSNLFRRGVCHSNHCPICLEENDDCRHLFRRCPLATATWEKNQLPNQWLDNYSLQFMDWLMAVIFCYKGVGGTHGDLIPSFVSTLWAIWITRNNQVFRQQRTTIELLQHHMDENMNQHMIFANTCPGKRFQLHLVFSWLISDKHNEPPRKGKSFWMVLGEKNLNMGGAAWVATVLSTQTLYHQGKYFFASSTLLTKAHACLLAILWAKATNFSRLLIYSDFLNLVQQLISHHRVDIKISNPCIMMIIGLHICSKYAQVTIILNNT